MRQDSLAHGAHKENHNKEQGHFKSLHRPVSQTPGDGTHGFESRKINASSQPQAAEGHGEDFNGEEEVLKRRGNHDALESTGFRPKGKPNF